MNEVTTLRGGAYRRLPDLDRLMTRVEKTKGGHWMWTGSRFGLNREYGQVNLHKQRMGAHRAMWILLRGPIPDGLDLLHQCGQTLCINPAHLRPGTHKENLQEAVDARGGKHWAPRGEQHPYAKLTQAQVDTIRRRQAEGALQSDLAREYGVTQPAISHIVLGKSWKL